MAAERCHGEGEIEVGIRRDEFGTWDTEIYKCPGCVDCDEDEAREAMRGPSPEIIDTLYPYPMADVDEDVLSGSRSGDWPGGEPPWVR